MPPKFIYFDLGQVLVHFDRQRQFAQMAEVAGVSPDAVHQAMMDDGLQDAYESGQLDTQQVFERFCDATGANCDLERLLEAASDIFWLNSSIIPLVSGLWSAGYRLGILSNTCPSHWQLVSDGRFVILRDFFEVVVLSYEVGAMKPAPEIYAAAAEQAGVAPQEIFYTDDIEGHVVGACEFGFDAVLYTETPKLAGQLRERGVTFNY